MLKPVEIILDDHIGYLNFYEKRTDGFYLIIVKSHSPNIPYNITYIEDGIREVSIYPFPESSFKDSEIYLSGNLAHLSEFYDFIITNSHPIAEWMLFHQSSICDNDEYDNDEKL